MAQLTDDCFAFGGRLLPLEEARAQLRARFRCVAAIEDQGLWEACGRVLARDVVAPLPLPPADNSAVDGWAIHHADLLTDQPTVLPVVSRVAAGHPSAEGVPRGFAARVFTGAVMPPGPDTVMMQEDCVETAGGVELPPGIKRGANRRSAGEDIARGERALPAGRRLSPVDLALLSGLGLTQVAVRTRLRVAVFSTGDEIAQPGVPLVHGQVYDANRAMLIALLARVGARVSDGGILPDHADETAAALLAAARQNDLVITSGGVSTGEEDHVRTAIEQAGRLEFWRVGIKPGRPVALGEALGTPLLGLPGNPVAALVTFFTIARPLIDALAGAISVDPPRFTVASSFAYRKKRGRREYTRVILEHADGATRAKLFPKEGAGIITSLTHSDALAEMPEDVVAVAPGDPIAVIPLGLIHG